MQFFMLAWCTGPDVLQRRSKNHRSGQYDWYAWTLDQHSIHVAMLHHRCRCLGRFGRGEWDSLGGTRVREGRSMPNYPSQHGWIAPQMYRVHRSYSLRWPCFLVAFWFYTVNSQIAEQPWSCVPYFQLGQQDGYPVQHWEELTPEVLPGWHQSWRIRSLNNTVMIRVFGAALPYATMKWQRQCSILAMQWWDI